MEDTDQAGEDQASQPEAVDAPVRPAPVSAFNLPPLPPIPAQTGAAEAAASDMVQITPAVDAPVATGEDEPEVKHEASAGAAATSVPAQPEPTEAPAPDPKQGDLLASAQQAGPVHDASSTGMQPPKDAAQG
jgi:hypothetical protein